LGARRISSGFSLLELLVVVFIIGILATMFTLSVGVTGGDQDLEREVDRLRAVLKLASQEAIMEGREIGMRFYNDGYEFAAYYEDFVEYHDPENEEDVDQSEWTMLSQEELLGPRKLAADIVLELEIDGQTVVLDSTDGDEYDREEPDPDEKYRPQIRLFSSGDVSPFVVRLRRSFENNGINIEVEADGTVELDKGD
jgi:general secretion pathway protein H